MPTPNLDPLDSAADLHQAGAFVLGCRLAVDGGADLCREDLRRVLSIAYRALLRVAPREPLVPADTRPPPTWLVALPPGDVELDPQQES